MFGVSGFGGMGLDTNVQPFKAIHTFGLMPYKYGSVSRA